MKSASAAIAAGKPEPKGSPKRALRVAQKIVKDIERRGAAVGDKLPPEQEMIVRYGVARATLREALRFLELQGVISLRPGPGGGPVVQEPHPNDFASTIALLLQFFGTSFRSLIEVRQAVSPTMAALAAERATAEEIHELGLSLARLRAIAGRPVEYAEENRRFHDLLAWASGNPLIGIMISSLHSITSSSDINIDFTVEEQDYQLKAYGRILKAIAGRNPEQASAELSRFIDRSGKYLELQRPELMSKLVHWQDADGRSVARARRKS